jgi:hypothetical protein
MLLPIPNTKGEDIHILYIAYKDIAKFALVWSSSKVYNKHTIVVGFMFPIIIDAFFFHLADLLWDLVQSASFVCMQSILLFEHPLPKLVTKLFIIII